MKLELREGAEHLQSIPLPTLMPNKTKFTNNPIGCDVDFKVSLISFALIWSYFMKTEDKDFDPHGSLILKRAITGTLF